MIGSTLEHRLGDRSSHSRASAFAADTRAAFTLAEMMVAIMVIGILASMVLMAMASALEVAKQDRSEAQVARLHQLVMLRWEEFQTRRVPLHPRSVYVARAGQQGALLLMQKDRTDRLRELLRMEIPDRVSDVMDPAVVLIDPNTNQPIAPTMWRRYRRMAQKAKLETGQDWTPQYQGAECLYLIVATTQDGSRSGLEYFTSNEIGDVDGDGMKEILDGWGNPIEFLRWAPGYSSTMQPNDLVDLNGDGEINELDWQQLPYDETDLRGFYDKRRNPSASQVTFGLVPLIISAGPDGQYEYVVDTSEGGVLRYYSTQPPNNPFYSFEDPKLGAGVRMGTLADLNQDGELGYADNITNHLLFGT